METYLENTELGSSSLGGGDSNAEILPAKKENKNKNKRKDEGLSENIVSKKHKRKMSGKIEMNKNKKLSNSQKRKLKRLEEEKEKAILLSKSIETLEKYKISEDASRLLLSSKSIGKAETMLEKRQRAVQFSKAGLEVTHKEESFKKRDRDSTCEAEPEQIESTQDNHENDLVHPTIVDTEALTEPSELMISSSLPVCNEELGSNSRCDGSPPTIEVSSGVKDTSKQETVSKITTDLSEYDVTKNSRSEDPVDEKLSVDARRKINNPGCPLQKHSTPVVVHVSRLEEVEDKRKDLPIVMMEQEIMEAINDHSSLILCGETGCGKTTQVPQFLYEAGFGSKQSKARSGIIGVTQPRRVAVLATAKRVAYELGLRLGKEIGFQVRHDKKVGESCSIKFMTDGILLREVQNDMLLRRYSVLILDEAHERSLNTDILIGMLSRVIIARQHCYEKQQELLRSGKNLRSEDIVHPIKLILMSATLRVQDFITGRRLFREPPPIIEVPTRQYPVTVHFSKRTEIVDYVGQAYKKVMSIHKRLPQGGILVFLTGQREVDYLCQKLRKASKDLIARTSKEKAPRTEVSSVSEMNSLEGINMEEINEAFETHGNPSGQPMDRFESNEEDLHGKDYDGESDSYDSETDSELDINDDWNSLDQHTLEDNDKLEGGLGEDVSIASLKAAFETLAGKKGSDVDPDKKENVHELPKGSSGQIGSTLEKKRDGNLGLFAGPLCVLPLYAMLPAAAQLRVFEEVKEGERLVVVATNVAETSLTIPGIKYVVDTGREKVKNYNRKNGMETYEVQWISKASASQRSGRAGRTGPGHCYRLYSSAVFNNIFPDFSSAEISKVPVDGVVLLLKSMHISKVANFPFPTPPETSALDEAERCLKTLEALDEYGNLTTLGKAMAYYPMSPRHSRMLLTVIQIMRQIKDFSRANLVLGYAVAAAAALSLSNPLVMQFEGNDADKHDRDQDEGSSGANCANNENQEKLKKKKFKEAAKATRAKFSNPSSDALTIAYALQCYELSKSPVAFCNENGLHLKTMEEMSKLRKQLLQLVFNQNVNSGVAQEFSWTHGTAENVESSWRVVSKKNPLLQNEEELLGQAICAGWADRVAKRIRGVSGLSEEDRKVNSVRYQACIVQETVFLHRWSSVSPSAPEFLVYSELLQTKRPYMHGATSVKSEWLVKYATSLCTFSAPLTDPKPFYDPQADQVYCWVIPTFGPHRWELPLCNQPINNDVHRVAVFAYSLLEGNVLPCLKSVRKFMSAPPGTILRPEASGQRRVGTLLHKLKSRSIDSCATLRKALDKNPKVLHAELLDWFQEGFHNRFEELWLDILREALLNPQERFPKKIKKDKRLKLIVA